MDIPPGSAGTKALHQISVPSDGVGVASMICVGLSIHDLSILFVKKQQQTTTRFYHVREEVNDVVEEVVGRGRGRRGLDLSQRWSVVEGWNQYESKWKQMAADGCTTVLVPALSPECSCISQASTP